MVIDAVPPSLNVYLHQHWRDRSKVRDEWCELVMAAACGQPRPPLGYKRVTVTLYLRRLRDLDNAYGGIKPLVDALRLRGLIEDDAPDCIELVLRQHKAKVEMTIIEIEEAELGTSND
jgi:Holliday junction resolvase RusA-like endonuclease